MTKNLDKKDIIYIIAFGFLCLILFAVGLVFIFTSDLKGLQNDSIRESDFGQIKNNIQQFVYTNNRFPKDLNEVDDLNYGSQTSYTYTSTGGTLQKSVYKDPKSGNYYDYKSSSDGKSFQICTDFEVGSDRLNNPQYKFKKGDDCVSITIEKYYIDLLKAPTPTQQTIVTPSTRVIQ